MAWATNDGRRVMSPRWTGFSRHPYLLFLCVVLAVWLPAGFGIGPFQREDWGLLNDHLATGAIFDPMWTRLLRDVPVWLGLHLTPDGFEGWQLMLLLITFARGALVYELVRRLVPESRALAVACGLLALFHPADSGYFWLNTTGEQFSLALTLGSCLCACMHLDTGGKRALSGMWALQLMAGFTYSGFLPLMFAIPAGAWLIRRVEDGRPDPRFLLKAGSLPVALAVFGAVMVHMGIGRDADVADVSLAGAASGYAAVARSLATAIPHAVSDYAAAYAVPVLVAAAAAVWIGWDGKTTAKLPRSSRLRFWVILLGFLALAALAYLPYSITSIRFADRRQLLGAGLFAYAAALFVLFTLLARLPRAGFASLALVALTAVLATVSGLEKRAYILERYQPVQALLAGVATAAPHPPSGAFILVSLQDVSQAQAVKGLYRHQNVFTYALRYMYGDPSLSGGFYGFGESRARVTREGLNVYQMSFLEPEEEQDQAREAREQRQQWYYAHAKPAEVDYSRLLLVDYPRQGSPVLPDAAWLAERATPPLHADSIPYKVPDVTGAPAVSARTCGMFQAERRPGYCRR